MNQFIRKPKSWAALSLMLIIFSLFCLTSCKVAKEVAKDAATIKTDNKGNKSVSTSHTTKLKEAVYKKLLQETDSFTSSIFK